MGAYETWQTTRELAAEEKDPERKMYLDQVQEGLQPSALLDYLETASSRFYRDPDGWSEDDEPATSQEVRVFLAGLDELRAPSTKELDAIRRDLHKQVLDATAKLLRLPWTGETSYDEAIADVRAVLSAVIDGKPWPVLERLRCPSRLEVFGTPDYFVQCEHQLPHDGDHRAHNDAGGPGHTWTDEQALNPPKDNDEFARCTSRWHAHRCGLPEGHEGRHSDAGYVPVDEAASWETKYQNTSTSNPDPINRPTAEQSDGACGAKLSASVGPCIRPRLHDGMHRDAEGGRWARKDR